MYLPKQLLMNASCMCASHAWIKLRALKYHRLVDPSHHHAERVSEGQECVRSGGPHEKANRSVSEEREEMPEKELQGLCSNRIESCSAQSRKGRSGGLQESQATFKQSTNSGFGCQTSRSSSPAYWRLSPRRSQAEHSGDRSGGDGAQSSWPGDHRLPHPHAAAHQSLLRGWTHPLTLAESLMIWRTVLRRSWTHLCQRRRNHVS